MADKKTQDESPKLPYLAIRNWAKFQSTTDKNGKSLEGRARPYIRDYCDKETDSQYAALSIIGRYLFDACRRLRGKHGRNLPNDYMWILRQLDVDHTERGRATHALQALVTRGLLIPCNEQFDIPQPAAASLSVNSIDTDTDTATGTVDESSSSTGEQETAKPKPHAFNVSGSWLDELKLNPDQERKFLCVMQWKEKNDFWKGKTLFSLKAYETVEAQYDKFYAKAAKKPHDLPRAKAVAAPASESLGDSAASSFFPPPGTICVDCGQPDAEIKLDRGWVHDVCPKAKAAASGIELPKSKAFELED
ncbi:MAG: hypothetical protein LAO03_10215 [Acidobacteriia bacterium]|nr:hypothetical protein [Terriglobia bacterium]